MHEGDLRLAVTSARARPMGVSRDPPGQMREPGDRQAEAARREGQSRATAPFTFGLPSSFFAFLQPVVEQLALVGRQGEAERLGAGCVPGALRVLALTQIDFGQLTVGWSVIGINLEHLSKGVDRRGELPLLHPQQPQFQVEVELHLPLLDERRRDARRTFGMPIVSCASAFRLPFRRYARAS